MGWVPYSEFAGARVRLQRLSDQQVFSAWLETLQNECILIQAEDDLPVLERERFLFQVQGPSADAYFLAESGNHTAEAATCIHGATATKIVDLPAMIYRFNLITPIQMRAAQQQARKAIGALAAKVRTCGRTAELLVTDASVSGMGVIAWDEMLEGDVVEIEITAQDQSFKLTCEVRHCRPASRLIGAYRVGLQFKNADRLAQIAWRKLLNPI